MDERIYANSSTVRLQKLSTTFWHSSTDLQRILDELQYRETPAAVKLRHTLTMRLRQLSKPVTRVDRLSRRNATKRTYSRSSLDKLQKLSEAFWDSPVDLRKILDELEHRISRAAVTLRRKINLRIRELGESLTCFGFALAERAIDVPTKNAQLAHVLSDDRVRRALEAYGDGHEKLGLPPLTWREQIVLVLRATLTLREIAEIFGLSRERIRQIESRAHAKQEDRIRHL